MLKPAEFNSLGGEELGGSAHWMPTENPSSLVPKLIHRRAKRIIPDNEKDDKYWEKRKRNNMAAKRSRENKRQLEIDIRNKVNYLEEENALLQKEVMAIKSRYGLPLDQSVLTPEERAQCLQEIKNAQAAAAEGRAVKVNSTDEDVSSTSPGIYPIALGTGLGRQADQDCNRGLLDSRLNHSPARSQVNGQFEAPHIKDESPVQDLREPPIFVPNGPSVYGPFSPSVVWGPSAGHHEAIQLRDGYGTMLLGNQQPHQHQQQLLSNSMLEGQEHNRQAKLPSHGGFLEKSLAVEELYGNSFNLAAASNCTTSSTVSGGRSAFVNGNLHHYNASKRSVHFDCYMAAAYAQGQAMYNPSSGSPNQAAARNSKQQNDGSNFPDKSSLPGGAMHMLPRSLANGRVSSQFQHQPSGLETLMNAVSMTSLAQSQRASLFRGSMIAAKGPDNLLAGGDNGSSGDKRIGIGEKPVSEAPSGLQQENDVLLMHIKSLKAEVDQMKKLQSAKK